MIAKIMTALLGSKSERDLKALLPILRLVNAKEAWALALSEQDFPAKTQWLKQRIAQGESLDALLPEAFALAREACRRVLGERPYDVQIIGGIALHQGKITEMKTGEGKTLTSVTAAYLNAIAGKGVHIVTVNDYLAERDARWMGRVHQYLGLSVGLVLSHMDSATRREAYACDITYATNNELGFDYLRDNMHYDPAFKAQRGHAFAVVDEIDSILIDEARTPLIISGSVEEDTTNIVAINGLVSFLTEVEKDANGQYPMDDPLVKTVYKGDYKLDEKSKSVQFTDAGYNTIERLLQQRQLIAGSLFDGNNFEFVHYFTQAIKAHKLFEKDTDYVVQDNGVQIVDEFTGRILHGRRYSDGLHQAIEAKEGIQVAKRNVTLATITFQNFFRMYGKLAGMTGTADTEAREFAKIYDLDVVVVPTNRQVARIDEQDEIYLNETFKFNAIADEIATQHKKGQPILVGTVSVDKSERLSQLLTRRGIRHEVLNAKNHAREAYIISEAGAKGSVTIATNMAGRGTDIKLGGSPEMRASKRAGSNASPEEYDKCLAIEMEKWKKDYEEVKSLGGLYVIGTERHESRRIDNQLRGRAGRQGDPGRSKFYISLDDDLMRLFGGERFRAMMARFGMDSGEALQHSLLSGSIERAQKRVEERNYEIRKHLLEYDDVLNKQRHYFYEVRDSIMQEPDMASRVINTGMGLAQEIFEAYEQDQKHMSQRHEADATLLQRLQEQLAFAPAERASFLALRADAMLTEVKTYMDGNLQEKAEVMTAEQLNQFLRYEYINLLDDQWQEHLEQMEALRDAVGLRHYAQKNPLVEYKLEGFKIFDRMIDAIPVTLVKKIMHIRIALAQPNKAIPHAPAKIVAQHQSLSDTMSSVDKKGTQNRAKVAQADHVQVRRTEPKLGRNEPCPCGSGKKYKHCHGKG